MIDAHGVGYELEASMNTFQSLPELGAEVVLFTHLAVREDAHALYGAPAPPSGLFCNLDPGERVGPRWAADSVRHERGGVRPLRARERRHRVDRLPGIGKKTAERLIIEMRDRDRRTGSVSGDRHPVRRAPGDGGRHAARRRHQRLGGAGLQPPEASRMVQSLDTEGLASEAIIRLALQSSVRR